MKCYSYRALSSSLLGCRGESLAMTFSSSLHTGPSRRIRLYLLWLNSSCYLTASPSSVSCPNFFPCSGEVLPPLLSPSAAELLKGLASYQVLLVEQRLEVRVPSLVLVLRQHCLNLCVPVTSPHSPRVTLHLSCLQAALCPCISAQV